MACVGPVLIGDDIRPQTGGSDEACEVGAQGHRGKSQWKYGKENAPAGSAALQHALSVIVTRKVGQ